jgi:hypothetical protein
MRLNAPSEAAAITQDSLNSAETVPILRAGFTSMTGIMPCKVKGDECDHQRTNERERRYRFYSS